MVGSSVYPVLKLSIDEALASGQSVYGVGVMARHDRVQPEVLGNCEPDQRREEQVRVNDVGTLTLDQPKEPA